MPLPNLASFTEARNVPRKGRVISSPQQKGTTRWREEDQPPPGRTGPTDDERIEQARDLYERERQRADRLEQEIQALRTGQRPGRDPLRRRGPPTHRFSIPRPDNYKGPPASGPSGTYDHEHPLSMNGIKPILMEKPQYFEGAHDDIERFLGDCETTSRPSDTTTWDTPRSW